MNGIIYVNRHILSVSIDTDQMNKALIVYLIAQKKKTARKETESKHAIRELKKQPTVTF
jgi:hypothetical protein